MGDPILTSVLAVGGVLTTVYWACAIVGVGLMIISVIGGSDSDADVDIDADLAAEAETEFEADVDADMPTDGELAHHHPGGSVGASSLAAWFSMRFLVYFVAVFGALGLVLTHLTQVGPPATFGVCLLSGLVAGQGVHQLFRKLGRSSGNTAPRLEDYVNKIGRVTMAIEIAKKGEVSLNVRGGQRYIPAVSKHSDTSFKVGDEVAVVEYRGNAATVVSRKEFEFLRDTK